MREPHQKDKCPLDYYTSPLLLSVDAFGSMKTPAETIEYILKSRMSLEDKLARVLIQRTLSPKQKSMCVTQLIEWGADVSTRNHVALRWAAEHGFLPLVMLTLDRGSDIHCLRDEPLSRSALNGHDQVVELLLHRGAEIHAKDDVALRLSASVGHLKVVELLLKKGADVSAKHNEPLRKAFDGGHTGIMKALFEKDSGRMLEKAKSEQDDQIFAIAWQYAKQAQDTALLELLESYEYRPDSNKLKHV